MSVVIFCMNIVKSLRQFNLSFANSNHNYIITDISAEVNRIYWDILSAAVDSELRCSLNTKNYCLKSKRPRKEIPLIAIMYWVNLFIGCLNTFA